MIPVDRVLQPAYEGTSAEYDDFLTAMEEAKITPENVTQTQTFQFGQASITVEPPASYEIPDGKGEYDNNFSLITTVELGAKRLVFTGDAEKKRIREWLSSGTAQPCDFLKVPHHGVYNKALPELFETLHPAYAVICDSAKTRQTIGHWNCSSNAGRAPTSQRTGTFPSSAMGRALQ
jgi:beta-lactamase superfamily II metal-dependent hydrolase